MLVSSCRTAPKSNNLGHTSEKLTPNSVTCSAASRTSENWPHPTNRPFTRQSPVGLTASKTASNYYIGLKRCLKTWLCTEKTKQDPPHLPGNIFPVCLPVFVAQNLRTQAVWGLYSQTFSRTSVTLSREIPLTLFLQHSLRRTSLSSLALITSCFLPPAFSIPLSRP